MDILLCTAAGVGVSVGGVGDGVGVGVVWVGGMMVLRKADTTLDVSGDVDVG